jgi:hypothetical protein
MGNSPEPAQCPYCRLKITGGWPACNALFAEVRLHENSDARYGRVGRITVDTYCMQHEEHYCGRAVGLAAHLGGLCIAVEHGGHPNVYHALHLWLDRAARRVVEYPPQGGIPALRGSSTIADVSRAAIHTPEAYASVVRGWAATTWEAFSLLQPLARGWVEEALNLR